MLFPVALFASVLILQQTPATTGAQTSAQTPAPAPVVVAQENNLPTVTVEAQRPSPTQTCRTEAVTGSRFGRRVCRNNVQSDDDRRDSREMLRRMQGARMPDS